VGDRASVSGVKIPSSDATTISGEARNHPSTWSLYCRTGDVTGSMFFGSVSVWMRGN
jgi:hypothetical protein